jgi:hypothetical protein
MDDAPAHGGADLGEVPDRVANLPIEDAAVGDDDDRVEDGGIVILQVDHLVREFGGPVPEAPVHQIGVFDQVAFNP